MLRLYGRNWHDVESNAIYIKAWGVFAFEVEGDNGNLNCILHMTYDPTPTFTQHDDYCFIHSKKKKNPITRKSRHFLNDLTV